MPRYAALLMEMNGIPFAGGLWIELGEDLVDAREIAPWQAVEIYLHALDLGVEDDPFACRDPSHGHPVDDVPDTARIIERIIGLDPAPAVLARIEPFLDRLEGQELRRVLAAWRKRDPDAPAPLVRLIAIAEKERRYGEAAALVRQGDGMKILDPEFARLRLRVLCRTAEHLLVSGKRAAAAAILDEIGQRPADAGTAGLWLLALCWAAAPPDQAGELLAELARGGVAGEIVMAEMSGELSMPFALPSSQHSPEELLEGVQRGITLLRSVGRIPHHCAWIVSRTEAYLDRASDLQLLGVGSAALVLGLIPLAWRATARGLERGGAYLHRALLLRAEILVDIPRRPETSLLRGGWRRASRVDRCHLVEVAGADFAVPGRGPPAAGVTDPGPRRRRPLVVPFRSRCNAVARPPPTRVPPSTASGRLFRVDVEAELRGDDDLTTKFVQPRPRAETSSAPSLRVARRVAVEVFMVFIRFADAEAAAHAEVASSSTSAG